MKRVGLVGWRGMVGSVLMERMQAERDFAHFEPVFFTTSNVGRLARARRSGGRGGGQAARCQKCRCTARMEIIVTCQGGDYTNEIFPQLAPAGWNGYWIDAASALRMKDDAVIILDPVNLHVIEEALSRGVKNYIGGNCTVSLMLMGLQGLFQAGPGRMDDEHDLPGGQRGRRAEHARAAEANGGRQRLRARATRRPGVRHPRDRSPRGRNDSQLGAIRPSISASRWPAA